MHLLLVAVMFLMPVEGANAEVLELPIQRSLVGIDTREITLKLAHASPRIVVDPQAAPRLLARRLPGTKKPSVAPAMEWRQEGGVLILTRTHGQGSAAGDSHRETVAIELDLVVPSVETLRIEGRDLDLVVHELSPAQGQEPQAGPEVPETRQTPWLHLQVEGSQVRLLGIPGGRLSAVGGSLHLSGTRGPVSIRAQGVESHVESHRGRLRFEGKAGELVLQDHRGELGLTVDGSHVVVRDGEGQCRGRIDGGWIELEGWRGQGVIQGQGGLIEVRRAGGPGTATDLALEGRGLEVVVDGYHGTLTARLAAGSLRGGGVVGKTTIAARSRTTVDLTDLGGGETRLELESGASAHLAKVADKLVASVKDARLEAHGIANLNLLAQGAEVYAGELPRLGRATASGSLLELDLRQIEHRPVLILKGSSRARVRLPLPCEVRVVEPGELDEDRARVSGCELLTLSRPGDRFRAQTRVEGAVKLVASLSEESSLVVRGGPLP